MMRKTFLALALSAGMAALLASPARAGMIPDVANPGDGGSPLMQQAQFYVPLPIPGVEVGVPFFFGGHDYCWYDDGWQGAGWYWWLRLSPGLRVGRRRGVQRLARTSL